MSTNGIVLFTLIVYLLGGALVIALVAKLIGSLIERGRTKLCIACQSRVPNAATKCKFCGSDLAV